jgi:hypothetical protein
MVLARLPPDGTDELDLDLRGVLLGVPFTDVDQPGLDEVEAVEEPEDFLVGLESELRQALMRNVIVKRRLDSTVRPRPQAGAIPAYRGPAGQRALGGGDG